MGRSFWSWLRGSKSGEPRKPLSEGDRQRVHDLAVRLAQATYADPYRGSAAQSDITSIIEHYDALGRLIEPMSTTLARPADVSEVNGFFIEDLRDRYRLHGVSYDSNLCTVDWCKELLDGGKHHTQGEWIELTKTSEFKLASAPLYHASLASLYHNGDHPDREQKELVGKVRKMFAEDFRLYWMVTSSRVKYTSRGSDVVTHGWGYGNPARVHAGIVSPDGWVNAGCVFEDAVDALLGTRDLAEVEKVYEWVSGKKPYLWRFNSKPGRGDERAVALGVCDDDRFNISASAYIVQWPARGVVVTQDAKKISTGNEG